MFSTVKILFVGLAFCFASISFAGLPQELKTCEPKSELKAAYKFVDKTITIDLEGKDETGQPFKGSSTYNIVKSAEFASADFTAEDISAINTVAGILGFTGGSAFAISIGAEQPTQLMFFEFSPGQYSAVWVVQGWPVPLGKTDLCN